MAKKITLKNKNGDVLCPHTAIEQVQGLKDALDGKLGKTEKAASATKADSATKASKLITTAMSVSDVNNCSNSEGVIEYHSMIPNTATNMPTSMGYQNAVMSFGLLNNGATAQMFFSKDNPLYYRSSHTGDWKQLRTIDDKVTTSHIADAAITPAKIQTSIALNGTPSMTVEPTTSSPDKTIASVGLVKEAVADLEIDTRNLIPNSASIVTGSHTTSVYHCKQIKLPVGIKNGESYSFNCDSIMNTSGAATEYSLILYDLPNSKAASNYIHLTTENKVGYFTATRDVAVGSAYIFLYAGKYGATAGNNVTYINCSLVKGDKPMLTWQAAPEDMVSKKYLDEFEIGGTNLIPVSDFEIGGLNNYGVTEFYDNRVRSKNYIQISSRKISAKSWVSGKYKIILYFYNSNKTFIKHTFADIDWFEECQAYAVPEGTAFIKVVIRHSDNSTFVGTDLSSIKIKVENGDKITDWSPVPEDIQTDITNAESRAKTYAETQVGKVATGEIVAKKASTLYDDDSGTYKNWGEIDSAITNKIGNEFENYATKQYVDNKVASIGTPGNATETGAGIVRAATQAEVAAGHVSDNDPAEMAFVRPETLQSKLSNYTTTTAMTQAINESRQIIYYQSSQPSGGKNGDIWIKP